MKLFPKIYRRFTSLPVLGPVVEDFAEWLTAQGYSRGVVRRHVRVVGFLDRVLCHHAGSVSAITRDDLRACSQDHPPAVSTLHHLESFLVERQLLPQTKAPPSRIQIVLAAYREYLRDVRGLALLTIDHHLRTVAQLLAYVDYEVTPSRLPGLSVTDLEGFVRALGQHQDRAALQHSVAHLRSFLRFLAGRGELRSGLDREIDTPRVYRQEQLPRALPWETVQALLRSIDHRRPLGRRDYAIFLLIATYGLRAHEIAALTFDDIDWRTAQIRILRRKGGTPLLLPLSDAAGTALVRYVRHARPPLPYREVFLRGRAPAGVLKPTAVTEAFQAWVRRSGLPIPFQGPHCLRHSYAVHLLRQGVSLKSIGDILGHRSTEATCMYLRLAVDDLRDVALPMPREQSASAVREVER